MYRDTFSFSRLLSAVLFTGLLAMVVIGCDKNDKQGPPPTIPIVTTAALSNVNVSAGMATGGGSIVSDGGDTVSQNGIVWSMTNATPTLSDSIIEGVGSSGTFSVEITGLDFDKTYYFRAFATNSVGTGYGSVVTLTTTADSVKFVYNGEEVVYGVIVSSVTGKKWLDRNLGAKQVATAFDDYLAYGDLFQWGRPGDGHQLINWTASDAGTPVNGTSTELATSDTPGHNKFIVPPYVSPWVIDWRSDNNHNRWATNPQGPCPAGWHVPTIDEWMAEVSNTMGGTANAGGMTDQSTAYNQLKLTVAGYRWLEDADLISFSQAGRAGHYWSTSETINVRGVSQVKKFNQGADFIQTGPEAKASAISVRCLKDN